MLCEKESKHMKKFVEPKVEVIKLVDVISGSNPK